MDKNILILDADQHLCEALAAELHDAGHRVFKHARQYVLGIDLVGETVASSLPQWDEQYGPFNRIVFGLRDTTESVDSIASILSVEQQLSTMLGEIKACAQLLSRRDDSQLWILLQEDSMCYYLPIARQPIRSRALIATIKSLAKEVFGLGVRVNGLQIQPLAEQFDIAAWKRIKENIKAYAMKFKPQTSASVAKLICALLEIPQIPLAGMVIPIGVGFPEANL